VHGEFVKQLVDALEADRSAGAAAPKLLTGEPNGQPAVPTSIDCAGGHTLLRSCVAKDRGYGELDRGQYDEPEYVFSVNGGAAMFRREALEDAREGDQYFDEAFVAYKEDLDLSWRCRRLGWRMRYVPSAVGYHIPGFSA